MARKKKVQSDSPMQDMFGESVSELELVGSKAVVAHKDKPLWTPAKPFLRDDGLFWIRFDVNEYRPCPLDDIWVRGHRRFFRHVEIREAAEKHLTDWLEKLNTQEIHDAKDKIQSQQSILERTKRSEASHHEQRLLEDAVA